MADAARRYACRNCGMSHSAWVPRCVRCQAMAVSVVQEMTAEAPAQAPYRLAAVPLETAAVPQLVPSTSVPIPLSDVPEQSFVREKTGMAPLDEVLGGGLVLGSVIVLGGEPGAGKSSLCMQAVDGLHMRVLIATGEESIAQAAGRARRIGADSSRVFIVAETDLEAVIEHARTVRAEVVVIDSIQTMTYAALGSGPGSTGQVRECTARLVQFAKATDTSVWLIGHVTNDGSLAGPKTLKHLVDVVLELDVGARRKGAERIVRCAGKNRFGATNVTGHFELTAEGLIPLVGEDSYEEAGHMPDMPIR